MSLNQRQKANVQGSLSRFIRQNLLKMLAYALVMIVLIGLLRKYLGEEYTNWLNPVTEDPVLTYSVYSLSEIFFGIIPPEFFISRALKNELRIYIIHVFAFAGISYGAGALNFLLGKYLNQKALFQYIFGKYIRQYKNNIERWGNWVLIIAAMTPVPYSLVSLSVGAMAYPSRNYFLIVLFRFLRFAIYGFLIWESNALLSHA